MPAPWPRLTYGEVSERETRQRRSPANALEFEDCVLWSAFASVFLQDFCVEVTVLLMYFLIYQRNADKLLLISCCLIKRCDCVGLFVWVSLLHDNVWLNQLCELGAGLTACSANDGQGAGLWDNHCFDVVSAAQIKHCMFSEMEICLWGSCDV